MKKRLNSLGNEMKYLFAGDSWAAKAWTHDNYQSPVEKNDCRLATFWPWPYDLCHVPGQGNLTLLNTIQKLKIPNKTPIIWIYTEPGRDYGLITNQREFAWMEDENIFEIRQQLDRTILQKIRQTLPNPIGLIGGLSDVNVDVAQELEFTVLCASWQSWIAYRLNSQHFQFGWGASDIGWRSVYHGVVPSKAATFAWDEQIKEWCWWEEQGYFCHEHPTPLANEEFAEFLYPTVQDWLIQYE